MSRSAEVRRLRADGPVFCLEGGGTHSRGALHLPGGDGPAALAASGACNPTSDFDGSLRSARSVWEALRAETQVDPSEVVVVMGVAGLNPDGVREGFVGALSEEFRQVVPMSDGYAALVGSGGGRPCGMIVAGTGCAGHRLRPDGTSFQRDGWGWIGGDRGSGAWIGLRAIWHALSALDGVVESDRLAEAVAEELGGTEPRIAAWLGESMPQDIASIARCVFECAAEHGGRAEEILNEAAAHLRELFRSLECDPSEPLFLSGTIAEALADRIAEGMDTKPVASPGMALEGCRLVAAGKAPLEWPE